ncbi:MULTISPECIES: hypothetical protein [Paenarthrobacter]|uniref:hypothetical protein n=1 Tax=Paenarthrobacter TaxID=1742992 RepID=UPI000A8D0590|nr:hypothetical protein [Paenarthrobacter ureafaciens]
MINDKHVRIRIAGRSRSTPKTAANWKLSNGPADLEDELRRTPQLIKHWKYLWRREFVELRRGNAIVGTGHVDETTDDASVLWIILSNGRGRMLIHHLDGIDIWRLDHRITDQPSHP